jgi:tetratricopeptide (TPR) repeat protein
MIDEDQSYDGFLSYRVWCDKDVTEKLFLALERKGLRIFWDKECLKKGAPWEEGFVTGLQKSKRVVTILSEKSLEGIADKALKQQDNVLKEIELAVDQLAGNSSYVLPLLIGEYKEVDGVRLLKKFSAFGGLTGIQWPEKHSTTCSRRTIKETMDILFSVQGIHVDPDDISASCDIVYAALADMRSVEKTKTTNLDEANDHAQRGEFETAAELYMSAHKGGELSEEQKVTAMKECARSWFEAARWHLEQKNFQRARHCAERAKRIRCGLSPYLKQQARKLEGECRRVERVDVLPKHANFTETVTTRIGDTDHEEVYRRGRLLMRQANYGDAEQLFDSFLNSQQGLMSKQRDKLQKYKHICHDLMNRTAVRDVVENINWDMLDREDANVDSADDFLAIAGAAAAGVAAAGAVAVGGAAVGAAVGGMCFAGAFALVISRNFADASRPEFVEGVKRDLSAATGERASRFNFVSKEPGSVIMYFSIAEDLSADSSTAEAVHRVVLAQVDDKSSRLYQGAITCDIDAARTKATTATVSRSTTNTAAGMEVGAVSAISSNNLASKHARKFENGSELVLWQHGEDKVACRVDDTLGEGAHGVVLRVQYGEGTTARTCALKVKKFDLESNRRFLQLCEEAAVSVDLNFPNSHPNVVGVDFVCTREDKQELLFLMEFVGNSGDLDALLSSGQLYHGSKEEKSRRMTRIAHQLALSLMYIHSKGVLHQDIKPENVLYDLENERVKLADFGVSSHAETTTDDQGGTLLRASLEGYTEPYASRHVVELHCKIKAATPNEREDICKEDPLTHYDDIWSFAVTVLDLFAGGSVWRMGLPAYRVWTEKLDEVPTEFQQCSMPQGLAEILMDCLDQVDQLTMAQIVQRIGDVVEAESGQAPESVALGAGLDTKRANIIYNNLGLAFHSKNQVGQAAKYYSKALSVVYDNDARAQNNIGVALQALGMTQEATVHYRKAHKINPKHPFAEANLGSLMRAQKTGGSIPEGALDKASGIDGALAGAAASSTTPLPPLEYGERQRLRVYREQTAQWEECEVLSSDFAGEKPRTLVIFDGDAHEEWITELGLKVHSAVPDREEELRIGQTVRLKDDNGRPTGKQGIISCFRWQIGIANVAQLRQWCEFSFWARKDGEWGLKSKRRWFECRGGCLYYWYTKEDAKANQQKPIGMIHVAGIKERPGTKKGVKILSVKGSSTLLLPEEPDVITKLCSVFETVAHKPSESSASSSGTMGDTEFCEWLLVNQSVRERVVINATAAHNASTGMEDCRSRLVFESGAKDAVDAQAMVQLPKEESSPKMLQLVWTTSRKSTSWDSSHSNVCFQEAQVLQQPKCVLELQMDRMRVSFERNETMLLPKNGVTSVPRIRYCEGQHLRIFTNGKWLWAKVAKTPSAGALDSVHAMQVLLVGLEDGGGSTDGVMADAADGDGAGVDSAPHVLEMNLHPLNHAVALLQPSEYHEEMQRLKMRLLSEHNSVYDIFSAQLLDTLTQLSLLKFREAGRNKDLLKRSVDVDAVEYQTTRKASQEDSEIHLATHGGCMQRQGSRRAGLRVVIQNAIVEGVRRWNPPANDTEGCARIYRKVCLEHCQQDARCRYALVLAGEPGIEARCGWFYRAAFDSITIGASDLKEDADKLSDMENQGAFKHAKMADVEVTQARARFAQQKANGGCDGVDTLEILEAISAAGQREDAFWPDSGILMLGAAAIGKSTQLKRFVVHALHRGLVPILILVMELVQMHNTLPDRSLGLLLRNARVREPHKLEIFMTEEWGVESADDLEELLFDDELLDELLEESRNETGLRIKKMEVRRLKWAVERLRSENRKCSLLNMIQRYLESQHPRGSKDYRLLMQAVHERRVLFLIDGVDEAGGAKEGIERAIATELLDQGHKTIITSRHSGFQMESFERCKLVELLPMSRSQQEAMVRSRLQDEKVVSKFMAALDASSAYQEIASIPMMLSMMIAAFGRNAHSFPKNRSELYGEAVDAITKSAHQVLKGISDSTTAAEQEAVMDLLQELSLQSQRRRGQFRIFSEEEVVTHGPLMREQAAKWPKVQGKLDVSGEVLQTRADASADWKTGAFSMQHLNQIEGTNHITVAPKQGVRWTVVTTNKEYVIGMTHDKAHKSRLPHTLEREQEERRKEAAQYKKQMNEMQVQMQSRMEQIEKLAYEKQADAKGKEKRKKDLNKMRNEIRPVLPSSSDDDEAAAASSSSLSLSSSDNSETERPRGPNVETSPAVDRIDFGLRCMGDGTLCAFEQGLLTNTIGNYEAGDELAVMTSGNTVGYYRNNQLLYTSEQKPTFPLVATCAFAGPGAHASSVRLRLPTASRGWGLDGTRWESIKAMIHGGKLPILVSLGKTSEDIEEYRMSHLSFQEFFAARAIVNVRAFMGIGEVSQADEKSAAIAARICEGCNFASLAPTLTAEKYLSELLGVAPAIQAFMDTRWQMVLQMVADLLELRGGLELRCFADSILGDGRITVGSEGLRVTGASALAPYLRACTSVRLCFAAAKGVHMEGNSLDKEAFAIIDEAVAGSSGEEIALASPSDSKGYEINFMPSMAEEVAVTWEAVQGQLITTQMHTGGVLEKSTTASVDWETGAWSVERIHMDGVGQGVQWTATTSDKMYVIGLTHESTIGGTDLYYKIEHGLRCNIDGKLDVYDDPGHHETTVIGNYEAEDELAVMAHGDTVRYYCNEKLLHTSNQRLQFPLVAACAFANPGAKAEHIRLQKAFASGGVNTFDFECFKGLQSVDLRGVKAASAEMVLNLRIVRGLQVKCHEHQFLLGGWDAHWGFFGCGYLPDMSPNPWPLPEPTVVEMGGQHFGCGVRSKEALLSNQSGVYCFEFVAGGGDGSAFMIGVAGESVGVEHLIQREWECFHDKRGKSRMLHSKGWWGVHVYSGGKAGGVYQGARGETRQCLNKGDCSWHNGLGMSIDLALGQMRFYHDGEEMKDMAINDLPTRKRLYVVTGNLLTGNGVAPMSQTIRMQLPKPTHGTRLKGIHWALKVMKEKVPHCDPGAGASCL